MGLTFSAEARAFGATRQHELLPGGAGIAVTNANRTLYCHLLADYHLRVAGGAGARVPRVVDVALGLAVRPAGCHLRAAEA